MNDHLKTITYPGNIHLISSDKDLENIFHKMNSAPALGFDTETRPSFQKGEIYKVALLQLATHEDAFLIQLHKISNFEPIKIILESDNIIKVGAAIRDDLNSLQKCFKFKPTHFLEIQDLAKKKGLKNMGLKGMAAEVLNGALSKAAKISNWEANTLTEAQILYAATDAWVSLEILETLNSR